MTMPTCWASSSSARCPQHIHGRSLASAIHPFKDIEGMNPASIGNIVYNDLALAPCTAAASVELIKATGPRPARPRGRDGRPLRDRRQAGRVHADGRGRDGHGLSPRDAARSPRIRGARMPCSSPSASRGSCSADMVKPGAAVIDIGINQVTGPNGETMIVGDVDTGRREGGGELGDAGARRRRSRDGRDVHAQRDRRARQAARGRLARLTTPLLPHQMRKVLSFSWQM